MCSASSGSEFSKSPRDDSARSHVARRHACGTKTLQARDRISDTLTAGISGIPWGWLGNLAATSGRRLRRRGSDSGWSGGSIRKTSAVTDVLAQRLLVLGAFALLCAVVALAAVERRSQEDTSAALTSANAPADWNTAFAGSRGATGDAQRTTCGQVLAPESLGVTHPVLPLAPRSCFGTARRSS